MFPPLCFVDEKKGIIDKETDEKLKEILTEDEYNLISQKSKTDINKIKIKFRAIELIQEIF